MRSTSILKLYRLFLYTCRVEAVCGIALGLALQFLLDFTTALKLAILGIIMDINVI